MTTWTNTRTTGLSARLRIEEGDVHLERGQPPAYTDVEAVVCKGEDFLGGALNDEVVSEFGLMALVEALAVLKYERLPEHIAPTDDTPLKGRPRSKRFFGQSVRGRLSSRVWFFGRRVAIDIVGEPRYETTMSAVATDGLSPAHRQALGHEVADEVVGAAQSLEPLPCFCGTGCKKTDDHDALQVLMGHQHPRAPIDHSAQTGRCKVCGRWWTFEEMGDSHYSYHYNVRRFEP